MTRTLIPGRADTKEDNSGSLTAYYEGPFWVEVFERTEDGKLYVAKVVFGSEPSDKEILDQQRHLPQTTPEVDVKIKTQIKNPKRRINEAKKEICQRKQAPKFKKL